MASRSDCVFLARLSEQAERYPDMLEYVKQCVLLSDCHLTGEERSLLSVVYKNITGNLRSSWRIVHHLSTQRSSAGIMFQREAALLRRQQSKIEQELVGVCRDVLNLLESQLLPVALAGEEAVFYHKMRGDYYRYITEFSSDTARKEAAASSLEAYKVAYKLATSALEATHPTRLGLALNFAVYYRDVMDSPERACHLAKHAFDEAIAELDSMPENTYRDSLMILQLLRDDLTLWFHELQDRERSS